MTAHLLSAQIETTYSPIQQVSAHAVLHKTHFLIRKQATQEYGNCYYGKGKERLHEKYNLSTGKITLN